MVNLFCPSQLLRFSKQQAKSNETCEVGRDTTIPLVADQFQYAQFCFRNRNSYHWTPFRIQDSNSTELMRKFKKPMQ